MIPRAKVILYTFRKKAKGKYPVKLRLTFNRQHKDIVLGLDLSEEEFKKATQANPPKALRNEATKIQNAETKARSIISQMGVFTIEKFEKAFKGQTKDASDIFPFFDEYIDQLKLEGRIKTATAYLTAENAFKKFYGKKSLHLLDITPAFLKKFQEHMIADGKSITTVGIYVRALRAVYNYCIAKGIVQKDECYAFGKGKYIVPAGKNVKKALSLEDIKKINDYPLEPGSFKERARDMWMLSYYFSGINFKDLALLKLKNIEGDMVHFVREKTKRTGQGNQKIISCFITDRAAAIIERWSNKSKVKEQYLFPILEKEDNPTIIEAKVSQFIKNTNKHMKSICESLGIKKKATTYHARHTSASIMKKSGASIMQIQEALGHSSPMVTQKYLDSFDDDVKRNLAQALTSF